MKRGFAIKKYANTIDPAKNYYSNVLSQDEILSSLMTEAGRQHLASQMAVPIRTTLDYVGVCRKFFEIDILAQGQIARYDKDIEVPAYVVSKRGKVEEWTVEGEYVEPKTWEIFSPASIRLSEIQQRRFNVLDRIQEKIRIQTQIQEDDQFLALLDTVTSSNTDNNPIINSNQGCSKKFLNDLTSVVMDYDLPCYGLLMRFDSFKDLRGWDHTEVDQVTMREILQTGLYGTLWGIDIIVSRRVPKGTVYALTEPRFLGVFPVRTEFMVMPNDDPMTARIGFVGYEEIGMAVVNANGVAKGIHN